MFSWFQVAYPLLIWGLSLGFTYVCLVCLKRILVWLVETIDGTHQISMCHFMYKVRIVAMPPSKTKSLFICQTNINICQSNLVVWIIRVFQAHAVDFYTASCANHQAPHTHGHPCT